MSKKSKKLMKKMMGNNKRVSQSTFKKQVLIKHAVFKSFEPEDLFGILGPEFVTAEFDVDTNTMILNGANSNVSVKFINCSFKFDKALIHIHDMYGNELTLIDKGKHELYDDECDYDEYDEHNCTCNECYEPERDYDECDEAECCYDDCSCDKSYCEDCCRDDDAEENKEPGNDNSDDESDDSVSPINGFVDELFKEFKVRDEMVKTNQEYMKAAIEFMKKGVETMDKQNKYLDTFAMFLEPFTKLAPVMAKSFEEDIIPAFTEKDEKKVEPDVTKEPLNDDDDELY